MLILRVVRGGVLKLFEFSNDDIKIKITGKILHYMNEENESFIDLSNEITTYEKIVFNTTKLIDVLNSS